MDAEARGQVWYEVVEDATLRQGDIIRDLLAFALPQDLPVLRDPKPDEEIPVNAGWDVGDWIIMSASCDVDRDTAIHPFVLVCRVWPATPERLGTAKPKKLQERLEVIRKGLDPLRFLLAEHHGNPEFPLSFAEYRPYLTLPRDYLKRACVGRRLRLRAPYRESFGNWVGSNFARVGVEDEFQIPRFVEGEPSGEARLAVSGLGETSRVSPINITASRSTPSASDRALDGLLRVIRKVLRIE